MKEIKKDIPSEYLRVIGVIFKRYKELGDKTFEQLGDNDFYFRTDEDSNSIAMLIQHIGGNLVSRFTDFLTTDGEKSNRMRDMEFEEQHLSRKKLIDKWEEGWNVFFNTFDSITADDLIKVVTIRNEPHSVIEALDRAAAHYAYHIGQIVMLAKEIKKSDFKTLTIPKKKKA